jgi:hypothetical protein
LRQATSQRFPSRLEFRGPVSCRNRSWGSPFRGFPSRKSRAPLEVASAPLRSSTDVLERNVPDLIAAGFPDSHAFDAVAWFPRRLWAPFPRTEARFPVPLGPSRRTAPFRQLHPLRSLHPPASPFTPTRVAPSRRPILSWVSASLKRSPSTPRDLEPAQARGPEHSPSPEGSGTRLEGP